MKKRYFWGLPVILLVLGLVFAGCSHGSNDYDPAGTWVTTSGSYKVVAAGGSWECFAGAEKRIEGTYITAGDIIIVKYVRINTALFSGADAWFYYAALSDTYKNYLGGSETFQIPNDGTTTFTVNGRTFTKQ